MDDAPATDWPKMLTSHGWRENVYMRSHPLAANHATGSRRRFPHSLKFEFPKRQFKRYEPFQADRYAFVRVWHAAGRRKRMLQYVHSSVAVDIATNDHVLLTMVAKGITTMRQIDHAVRLMQAVERHQGFQPLRAVWDAAHEWIFVQALERTWQSMERECHDGLLTEDKLRNIVLQLVSLIHFLHAHGLSLVGEVSYRNLMMHRDKLKLLLHPSLVLDGCTLVVANDRNKAADIASIGVTMIQLCVLSSPPQEETDQSVPMLQHLSAPCRDMIVDCLTTTPTIHDLLRCTWLRQVDFITVNSRLDRQVNALSHQRRITSNALLWKMMTLLIFNWIRTPAGFRTSAAASHMDDEDLETRQRSKKPGTTRHVPTRKYMMHGHSTTSPPISLKRGALMLPSLSSSIFSQREMHSTGENAGGEGVRIGIPKLTSSDDDDLAQSMVVSKATYEPFGYAVPDVFPQVESAYDSFTGYATVDELTSGEMDNLLVGIRNQRSSSLALVDGSESIIDLKNYVVRSIHPGPSSADANSLRLLSSDPASSSMWSDTHADCVHFSAFGPQDIVRRDSFRIDIWAYLKQQRENMLEIALEQNETECANRLQPLYIPRGTLITVVLEPCDHYSVVGDGCKSFHWRGDIDGVSFDLFRKRQPEGDYNADEDELCIAKIIAGTKVSLLYVRFRITPDKSNLKDDSFALLDSTLEQLPADVQEIPSSELELIRPIGSGAFGDVMLAKWQDTTNVVVKTLHQDMYRNSDAMAEFRHEATVMHMLGKHPHIVELFGITGDNSDTAVAGGSSHISLVTEYLPNGSIQDVLRGDDTELPVDDRLPISTSLWSVSSSNSNVFSRTIMARDAAHGLTNIHQGHFLHCDIAARNCLVDEHFHVKVCDFGLSRRIRNSSGYLFDDDRHGFGPLKWMAPESILPPHLFSTQSDVYMFGVLMYEIFTGNQPFPTLSSREAMALILEGKHVPIPSDIPSAHQELMEKCFDPHPHARPSMSQIYTTLDNWVLHDTITQSPFL